MKNFWKILYFVGIFEIGSLGQSDLDNENENTCFCRLFQLRNVQVQAQQGRPGKLGPIGPPGVKGEQGEEGICDCNLSEIEQLNFKMNKLSVYADYCTVGMKDGRVNDNAITASSIINLPFAAANGRLDYQGQTNPQRNSAWAARNPRAGEWIQVDLLVLTYVTGVISQGRARTDQWIRSYKIAFANNTNSFQMIQDENGNDVVFPGNVDGDSYALNRFSQPITARYFRLIVVTWSGHISGRFEYITC